jgi:hypothetical protein
MVEAAGDLGPVPGTPPRACPGLGEHHGGPPAKASGRGQPRPASAAQAAGGSEQSDASLAASSANHSCANDDGDDATTPRRPRPSGRTPARAGGKRRRGASVGAADSGTDAEGQGASEGHKSSLTGETRLRSGARAGSRARVATPAAGAAADHPPRDTPAKPAARPSNRRPPTVWVSGQVVDPRTGRAVTEVPPASFCTQCAALTTPVWRAGPFGHKTLCNACGVRYMKAPKAAAKGRK